MPDAWSVSRSQLSVARAFLASMQALACRCPVLAVHRISATCQGLSTAATGLPVPACTHIHTHVRFHIHAHPIILTWITVFVGVVNGPQYIGRRKPMCACTARWAAVPVGEGEHDGHRLAEPQIHYLHKSTTDDTMQAGIFKTTKAYYAVKHTDKFNPLCRVIKAAGVDRSVRL